MDIISLVDNLRPGNGTSDECSQCRHRICCTVYAIHSSQDQWRKEIVIKKQWDSCEHMCENWGCGIYTERHNHPWYQEECILYTCHNIWPILSWWIDENLINLKESSYKLWLILRKLGVFVKTWSRYLERYTFIQKYLLPTKSSPSSLLQWLQQNPQVINTEFNIWASKNPIDPEFDNRVLQLISEWKL